MRKFNLEIAVGLFMVIGFVCFAWLSIQLGDIDLFGRSVYRVSANFGSVSGLKKGANVEIAGVQIGKVDDIVFDSDKYEALVTMTIENGVILQEDSIASVRTSGIIGDRYIDISPGGSDVVLHDGDQIVETESAINLEELVSKYIFEKQ